LPNGQTWRETGTDARNGRILVCAAYFCTQAGRNLVVTKQVCRYRAVSGFPGTTRRRQQNRDGGFEPLGGCAPRLPLGRLLSHIPYSCTQASQISATRRRCANLTHFLDFQALPIIPFIRLTDSDRQLVRAGCQLGATADTF